MDIKEFANDFLESVQMSSELNDTDYDYELASSILEYIVDTGEVNAPEICSYQKTRTRITAYDYNDEAESLDLFYLIKADTLVGKVSNHKIEQGINYLMSFYREAKTDTLNKDNQIASTDEVIEVAKLIKSTEGQIKQLRVYIITDGLVEPSATPAAVEWEDFVIEYNVWDMQRVYQQYKLRAGKEKVEIDFPTNYNTELQCLKMSEENPYIDAYLAIIPGITLAKIYRQYQQVLLEKNVRTFLQFKGKVNKQIRKTLKEEPDMFFSYNNGISTTASRIETQEIDGMLYITRLFDWQIVNGGQTTASIAACVNDKNVDLSKVFVPMKISVITHPENEERLIRDISTYANSQTAIKNSDLSANDPYLVDLEKFSRETWIPNGNNKPVSKWYFERTRGQYLDQLAQLSGFNEKSFKIEYPKNKKIVKTDIAKFEACWNQMPYEVCKGAERNYMTFVKDIQKNQPQVTAGYYKHLIAKCILYKAIDNLVKAANLGGYKANMNAYLMASISFLSNKKLDLTSIWENQFVPKEVSDKVNELIPIVWQLITGVTSTAQGANTGEVSKRQECWNKLRLRLSEVEKFDEGMLQTEVNEDGNRLNDAQLQKINEAELVESEIWLSLAKWARNKDLLTPIDRKAAYNFGTLRSRGKGFSLKQAQYALRIFSKAKELGFDSGEQLKMDL